MTKQHVTFTFDVDTDVTNTDTVARLIYQLLRDTSGVTNPQRQTGRTGR